MQNVIKIFVIHFFAGWLRCSTRERWKQSRGRRLLRHLVRPMQNDRSILGGDLYAIRRSHRLLEGEFAERPKLKSPDNAFAHDYRSTSTIARIWPWSTTSAACRLSCSSRTRKLSRPSPVQTTKNSWESSISSSRPRHGRWKCNCILCNHIVWYL